MNRYYYEPTVRKFEIYLKQKEKITLSTNYSLPWKDKFRIEVLHSSSKHPGKIYTMSDIGIIILLYINRVLL